MSTSERIALRPLFSNARCLAAIALAGLLVLVTGANEARAAANYGIADAAYVTNSRNLDVLDYVICLEGAVNRLPEAMPLAEALRTATAACRDLARKLPDSPDEPTAQDLVDTIRECGFFPEQASPDADCGGTAAASQPDGPDEVELSPVVIDVGTWPEGLVFDDEWLWVAESGDRSIARVNLARGRVETRKKIGRLPVDMATAGEGVVYTLVVTDKLINRQDRRGKSKALAKLSECPEAMADGIDFLWVITLPNCSSESSRLVRVDPASGKQTRTAVLGESAIALSSQGPDVWIAHARAPALTAVNQTSMKGRTFDVEGASLWSISANSTHVFAGGHVTDILEDGLVVMIDPTTGEELARASVTERVSEILADEDNVIAVGDKGTIWIYSAAELALRRTITASTGPFEPRDVVIVEGRLALSVANVEGEKGAVFLFDDWLPADASSRATAADPALAPVAKPPRRTTGVNPPRNRNAAEATRPPKAQPGFPIAAGSWGGNVRKGPRMGAAWVATLEEAEPVTLIERTGEVMNGYPWFRIRFHGNQTGYMWGGILCATAKPVAGIEGRCTTGVSAGRIDPKPSKGGGHKPPRSGNPADLSALLGTFQRDPVQNDWHTGNIERDGRNLRWTNLAGASWSLTPDPNGDRLVTGRENPYFSKGLRNFEIIRDHGDVVGFRFGKEDYWRAPEVRVLITPPPGTGNANNGAIRERDLIIHAGAGASVVSDGIPRGGRDAYRLAGRVGEILTVSVSAPDDNATFEIRMGNSRGKPLPGAADGNEARFWSDTISQDGDYLIIVGPRFGGTDYTLTVNLDPQQQPGADGLEDGEPEIVGEPAEDLRAEHDYSMVTQAQRDICSSQHSPRVPAFFDCLDDFKRQAIAANPDPRASKSYGLGNGAYSTCTLAHGDGSRAYYDCLDAMAGGGAANTNNAPAAPSADPRASKTYNLDMGALATCAQDNVEGTSAYFDCLDVAEANEAANNAAAAPQAPPSAAAPAADPRAGNDYGMIDHDARKECLAQHGDGTSASFDCLDAEKAKVEARRAQAEQARLDEEARLQAEADAQAEQAAQPQEQQIEVPVE